ncbi:amino acid adenylation domain-containing protein [Kitasatospora sp. NPDC058170]|uniref:amino acid adenylation domain-containing protein n=1 Tax=Kitasatospora sp. NPDC058170 TaxID=3346364 RepID=UPI0036D79C19
MTFLHRAVALAEQEPDAPAATFLSPDAGPLTLTRRQLIDRAGSVARQVRGRTAPGDRVLLALPTGPELVAALVGVLLAGRVAVPAPADPGARTRDRLRGIVADAGCALVLTRLDVADAVVPDLAGEPDLRVEPADLAVLQYTSGSTSAPKGVRVSTANLEANLVAIERAFDQRHTDVVAGWLPLFHDMGLVGTLLHPLRMGLHTVLMAPEHFVRRPESWLRAVSDFGVTTSGGPDFGYAWSADRVDPARLAGVDLSRWRVAFTGSEPVSPRTLERFAAAFAGNGFRAEALTPCYGLAESTLLVSSHPVGQAPRTGGSGVSCGRPLEEVVIVDADGAPVDGVGEIWVRGPSVAGGYHGRPGDRSFDVRTADGRGGWLRTGDLGELRDGELYVRGRSKDVVILRGENHHAADLEEIAGTADEVLAACAFAAPGGDGRERMVVAVEVRRGAQEAVELVRRAFRDRLALEPDEVLVVRGRSLPRTTSGKLQRSACRDAWAAGGLPVRHRWTAAGVAPGAAASGTGTDGPGTDGPGTDGAAASGAGTDGAGLDGPVEEALAVLWRDLLGAEVRSAHESFFAAGGASVLAVELSVRVADRFGVRITPAELLAAGSLRAQAALIGTAPRGVAAAAEPDSAPLSLQQEGLWLLSRLSPDAQPAVRVTVGVPAGADVDLALSELVRRHPGLATAGPDGHGRQHRTEWSAPAGRPDPDAGHPFTAELRGDRLELAWDHRAIDGWSIRVLLEELDALLAGRPLPPAPPSALAWAQAQREALAAGDDAADLDFWRDRLSDGRTTLPWAEPGGAEPGGAEPGGAEAGLTTRRLHRAEALGRLARELDTTPAVLVLAAVAVVLGRLSGRPEVAVGIPFANRTPPWTRTVGCLVSVQRAVAHLPDGVTGTELVRQLTAELQDLRGHSSVPLEALPGRLGLPGDRARVDVVFDHLHVPERVGALTVHGTSLESCPPQAKAPLTITAVEDGGLRLHLLRQRSYLGDEAAEELADQVQLALDALLAAADTPCLGWSLRTARAERELPLVTAPSARPDVPSVPASVMAIDPARTALRRGARTWTYGELQTRALAAAGTLQEAGLRPGDVVGVLGSADFDTVAAALGTMLAGGAVLHLDRRIPAGRLATMVREAGAALVLRAQGRDVRDAELGRVLEPGTRPGRAVAVDPGAPAYVVFSTGTTSAPKAIVGTDRGLGHFLEWQRREFAVDGEDRFVLLTNLAFDMALRDLWLPLGTGGVLNLLEDPERVGGDHVVPLLAARGVTRLHLLPTLARSWLATAEPTPLPALRSVFLAGEPLSGALVERFRRHFPGDYEVLNFYGPSETTQTKVFHRVPEQPPPGVQPIGRPLPQTAVTLVNRAGAACGLGESGEIVLRTPFATRGYANAPQAQAERFVPDPFGSGESVYRTGDLGRARLDGTLEILGRGDRQVKVHGVAVDPEEVADLLAGLSGVRQAAVRAEPAEDGDHRLVAWFAADRGWDALRAELADRLPRALVPERALACERLPVHPNGKVDLRSLPSPGPAAPTAAEPPADALEAAVLTVWRAALGEPELDVHADFFVHGGHSLKALELVAALARELGRDVPLADVLAARTPRELARRLPSASGPAGAGLPELVRAPDQAHEPFPMTRVQEAYWVGRRDFLELGGAAAQTYRELRCPAGLDLDRLERAFRRLVERHPSLRTVATEDGRQYVLPRTPPFRIPVQDLRPQADPEPALRRWREELGHRVRPLESWPLIEVRASLLPDEVRLHVGIDAWVCDAWSRVILVDELRELYERPDAELADLGLTFRDYVLSADAVVKDADLEWWRGELESLPEAPRLPLAQRTGSRFVRRQGRLDDAAWSAFQRRAGDSGVTPSAALLAAFGWVLARWGAQDRLALNVTVFRRLPVHPDVNRILGDFTSVLPHAMACRWDDFQGHARDVQARLWQELAHGSVSGVDLARESARRSGRLDATGLPVVFTSALTAPGFGRAFDWAWLGELVDGISQTPQVWLDLQVYEHRGELHFNWDAVEEMFRPEVLDGMVGAWTALLAELAGGSWRTPAPELLPGDQLALIDEANATDGPVLAQTLADGVLATLARTPDALAVIDTDRSLTFAQLVEEAERVAAAVLARRVPAGGRVAVLLPHGRRQAIAALGIVLAGAAYIPVDTAQPAERVERILQDALPDCVLDLDGSRPGAIAFETLPAGRARRLPEPADVAYLIYTSGTTGRPKGVVIRHEAAVNTLADIAARMDLSGRDRVLAVSPFAFDLSVWDLFGSWRTGAAVVYPGDRADPRDWAATAHTHRVRLWNSVPSILGMLVDAREADPDLPLPALRTVMLSGDWIPLQLPERLRAIAPEARQWSLGGATEASIWSIAHRIEKVDPAWSSIPYGRPLTNQTFEVLDEHLRPCPVHVTGALFIGGRGLADGYWRDEARTAERFPVRDGERLYRTGDLGRRLPDGSIEILGRDDSQVKIRGYRVELGEIEHALEQLPGVERAVVLAVGDPQRDLRLVGFVLAPGGTTEEELHRGLSDRLPPYMVPYAWRLLDALPLSANGKVDRAALLLRAPGEPAVRAALPGDSAALPTDSAVLADSEVLAAAWTELLGAPPTGSEDNFFMAGGDSVTWLRLCAQVSRAGWRLPVAAIARDATFGGISAELAPAEPQQPLPEGPTPPGPMRTWLTARGLPGHFNQAIVLRLLRPLDAAALDRALAAVVAAHPVLTATLGGETGGGHLVEQGGSVADACRGFPPDGPLLRATLLPGRLVLCAHHWIVDAQSWRVLVADLEQALDALEAGGRPELPPEAAGYAAWCHAVAALPAPALPVASPVPVPVPLPVPAAGTEGESLVTTRAFPGAGEEETAAALRTLRCTREELLLAAAAWADGTSTGHWEVELERHGRSLRGVDLNRTVGWLTTLVPLALRPGTPAEVLVQVKGLLRAMPEGGLALGAAHAASGRSTALAVNPLGRLDDEASERFELVREAGLPLRSADLPRPNERRSTLFHRGGVLHVELNHRGDGEAWLAALDDALTQLLATTGPAAAGTHDFPDSGLDDQELRRLLAGLEKADD